MERHVQKLVQADFDRLMARERLDCSAAVEQLIFVQTIEGHAHNGHAEFRQHRFVDVTIADVVRALGLNAAAVKKARQALIDDIFRWAERTAAGDGVDRLVDEDGKPLLTIPFLAGIEVGPADVLHGLYIGGLRDNSAVRARVEKERGVVIGGGTCYVVDTRVMREMGFDAESLAHESHEHELDEFRKRGLIVTLAADEVDDDRYRYLYIRDRLGPGHSDDAAVVFAGLLWGPSCALGVFLADAVDTLEKYSEKYEDQDDELSRMVGGTKAFEASWEENLDTLTFLAAVPGVDEGKVPDSSLRYFLRIDANANRCALQNHLDFIGGRPTAPMVVGFDRVLSMYFYRWVRERLVKFEGEAAVVAPAGATLATLAGVVDRNFLRVGINDAPEKVVEAFASSNAEIAVVLDGDGEVMGTVKAIDMLKFLWGARRR
jgi:hypothetical protein